MVPTFIGALVLLAGFIILVTRRIEAMFSFTMCCMLMGGSSAVTLTALGGSSIAPAQAALGLLLLRIVLPSDIKHVRFGTAVKANVWLVIYTAYAIVSAIILPRMFAGKMDVVPMRPTGIKHLFDTFPLAPSSQNITTTAYIFGTCLFACCVFIALRQPSGAVRFVKTAVVVTWIHITLGLAGLVVPKPIWTPFLAIVRNGSYAQLDQTTSGFVRISGINPEASSYAGFGVLWMVFMLELWLRNVMPRRTGPAAAAMAGVLTISTSSTAYVGMAGCGALMVIRLLINPRLIPLRKMLWLVGAGFAVATGIAAAYVLTPVVAQELTNTLRHFTVDKADSDSGLQRAFWAKQGWYAFKLSWGLGIGTGSFRSSSIFTAILGSTGVVGSAAMLLYVGRMFGPLRNSTYGQPLDMIEAVGVSASWTALIFFIPAGVAGASPDPNFLFTIFAASAISLRTLPRTEARLAPERQHPLALPQPA